MMKSGKPDRAPDGGPPDRAQRNFTDPDSRIQPTRSGAVIAGYNAQVAVDGAHQIIVAQRLQTSPTDARALAPLLTDIRAVLRTKAPGCAAVVPKESASGELAGLPRHRSIEERASAPPNCGKPPRQRVAGEGIGGATNNHRSEAAAAPKQVSDDAESVAGGGAVDHLLHRRLLIGARRISVFDDQDTYFGDSRLAPAGQT
jgi:hypothetical protein